MDSLYAAFFLPEEITKGMECKTLLFENHAKQVELKVPDMTKAELSSTMLMIKGNRQKYLSKLHTNEIVSVIDEAVQKWLNPSYELRQFAEETLPVITGYDDEMVRLFLSRYLRSFRKEKLQRIIDEDFANPLVLDEFRPRKAGGLTRAYGPDLITHIFSGNVPALPLWSLVSGLLVKSATLGKVSSSEPLFPTLFAKTIAEIDPDLAKTMAITWWRGGNDELEQTAFNQSQTVIAYGGESTMKNISEKVPSHVRFVEHGHKVSFGVITKECLTGSLAWQSAQRAAKDASWFDQQGCLSPHVFYVEKGGKYSPRDFARMLAHEMSNFEHKMSRATLTTSETTDIMKARSNAEFQSFTSDEVELLSSEAGTSWTVVFREKQQEFPLSVLNRFVTVVPVDDLAEVKEKTKEVRRVIQTVGIACPPQRFQTLIQQLGDCGANRISFLGEMSLPEPGWHHDGRFNLADLVYWCDVESSVENTMDMFDPYRD
ncbi:acyl-CoA reductase [Aquibacillus koreensis]|uniref:Acyl-CoA reductase n=1 Tax=Aquibacillus koreensis TaxID=279446 RepID=A0A9X3WK08_9BACI|nr:acyl-CoA reductase [Aquibacillus koreensis]MCT2536747.1 acyl-CoA reductase [Aquibacillus koreensis]MDC3421497.1 acyl-CoA reductase [Aquibacillus koreensis]